MKTRLIAKCCKCNGKIQDGDGVVFLAPSIATTKPIVRKGRVVAIPENMIRVQISGSPLVMCEPCLSEFVSINRVTRIPTVRSTKPRKPLI